MTLEEALEEKSLLLFDFDGVLADSEPIHRLAYNTVLAAWGHHVDADDYWLHWTSRGSGIEGEIERKGLGHIDPDDVKREKRGLFADYCAAGRIPLFPETPELLLRLIESSTWDVVIASNTPSSLVNQILTLGGASVPVTIVGGEDLPPKPAPDIFLRAAEVMGVSPSESLVVEDAEKGTLAARRGGFQSLLVVTDLNRNLDVPADYRIDGLGGLCQLLFPELRKDERR
jgi:HAD superfamily hydrolase (TIGR01509 family)